MNAERNVIERGQEKISAKKGFVWVRSSRCWLQASLDNSAANTAITSQALWGLLWGEPFKTVRNDAQWRL
jgi:hypothetical protein